MWLRNILTILVFLTSNFLYSQMNFKELELGLYNRINDLLMKDHDYSNDISHSIFHVHMLRTETKNFRLFINNKLPIDSLTPTFYNFEIDTVKVRYLQTFTYILDSNRRLVFYGDARWLNKTSKHFYETRKSEIELVSIFIEPSTKMVIMLGNEGIRLGYYLVIKDSGCVFYHSSDLGLKEINKEEYLEIISDF